MIQFEVLGTPAPKGSSRAILISGRAVNVPGGSNVGRNKLKSWEREVRCAADLAMRSPPVNVDMTAIYFVEQPVRVSILFRLQRPAGHWGKAGLKPSAPLYPIVKPDVDKLTRSTLDALTGLVFDDDSRVVDLQVSKIYAAPGREGALISVSLLHQDSSVAFVSSAASFRNG